ncbi:MAG: hypothetical protein ACTSXW_05265, partial [Candidatus Baldrarchaeia archaeon]
NWPTLRKLEKLGVIEKVGTEESGERYMYRKKKSLKIKVYIRKDRRPYYEVEKAIKDRVADYVASQPYGTTITVSKIVQELGIEDQYIPYCVLALKDLEYQGWLEYVNKENEERVYKVVLNKQLKSKEAMKQLRKAELL